MVINAAERFNCRHELVGLHGGFRCANCGFQVSELPLSKKAGATILNATFRNHAAWTPVPVSTGGPIEDGLAEAPEARRQVRPARQA